MTVQPVVLMGNLTLMRPASRVPLPAAPGLPFGPDIQALVQDMADSMEAAGGIGIAAPQIGVGLRVVMFHAPSEGDEGSDSTDEGHRSDVMAKPLTILINPEIEILTDEIKEGFEGCLSVPGLRGIVPRFTRLCYRGLTPAGELVERLATGFHAVVVQHECDHLDGILYPMRMTNMATLEYVSEIEKRVADNKAQLARESSS